MVFWFLGKIASTVRKQSGEMTVVKDHIDQRVNEVRKKSYVYDFFKIDFCHGSQTMKDDIKI